MSDATFHSDPALPGMKCVARDAEGALPRCAAAWSRAEVEFARRLIAAWREAFDGVAGGARANDTRRNRFVAIQFSRRNAQRPPDQRVSEDAILAAIRAYAEDPVNRKLGRWKSFGDYFRDAEDLIDRQRARVGIAAAPADADRRAAAQRLAWRLWAVEECVYAAQYQMPIVDYLPRRINELDRAAGRAPAYAPRAAAARRLLELHWRFERLSTAARTALEAAAADAFTAAEDRPPHRRRDGALDPIDAARVHGFALALLDKNAPGTCLGLSPAEAPP